MLEKGESGTRADGHRDAPDASISALPSRPAASRKETEATAIREPAATDEKYRFVALAAGTGSPLSGVEILAYAPPDDSEPRRVGSTAADGVLVAPLPMDDACLLEARKVGFAACLQPVADGEREYVFELTGSAHIAGRLVLPGGVGPGVSTRVAAYPLGADPRHVRDALVRGEPCRGILVGVASEGGEFRLAGADPNADYGVVVRGAGLVVTAMEKLVRPGGPPEEIQVSFAYAASIVGMESTGEILPIFGTSMYGNAGVSWRFESGSAFMVNRINKNLEVYGISGWFDPTEPRARVFLATSEERRPSLQGLVIDLPIAGYAPVTARPSLALIDGGALPVSAIDLTRTSACRGAVELWVRTESGGAVPAGTLLLEPLGGGDWLTLAVHPDSLDSRGSVTLSNIPCGQYRATYSLRLSRTVVGPVDDAPVVVVENRVARADFRIPASVTLSIQVRASPHDTATDVKNLVVSIGTAEANPEPLASRKIKATRVRQTTTGELEIPGLVPGRYCVSVTGHGFSALRWVEVDSRPRQVVHITVTDGDAVE